MRMVAVVLGGGMGQRIGAQVPKQLLRLDGRTLIEHCVAAFEQAPGVDEILVVMARGYVDEVGTLLADRGYGKVSGVIEGARPAPTRPGWRWPPSPGPLTIRVRPGCCCTMPPGRSSISGSSPTAWSCSVPMMRPESRCRPRTPSWSPATA